MILTLQFALEVLGHVSQTHVIQCLQNVRSRHALVLLRRSHIVGSSPRHRHILTYGYGKLEARTHVAAGSEEFSMYVMTMHIATHPGS